MRRVIEVGVVMMAFAGAVACDEAEDPVTPLEPTAQDGGPQPGPEVTLADASAPALADASAPVLADASAPALADASAPSAPQAGGSIDADELAVPAELVGVWTTGSLDLVFWEDYREGYWAGRNAIPTREAMIFREDGSAKFYRYEFAFNLYEELIDCEGTATFHDDGTFTFYPEFGRKRFTDFRHGEQSVDRPLNAQELIAPKLAGTRSYVYDGTSTPPKMVIKVPSSAAYNWYKQP